MFEVVRMDNGLVVAEIDNRNEALMFAANYADRHGFDSVSVEDEAKLILIEHVNQK